MKNMVKYHDFREKYHKRVLALRAEPPVVFLSDDRGGGGVTHENCWWTCAAGSPNPDPFQTKKCHFSYPFSYLASKIHTHSKTWPLTNYVIIYT